MGAPAAGRAADTCVPAGREVGAASPYTVLPPSAVTGVVTDAPGDEPSVQELRAVGLPLIEA